MGSIHFGVFTSGERPTSGCSLLAVITPSFLRLGSFVYFLFILSIASPSLVLGQIRKAGPLKVAKPSVIFTASPAKVEPGDIIKFVYKIYMDTEPPILYTDGEVKLKIRPFSERLPIPSLIHSSFQHIASYKLRPHPNPDSVRVPKDFKRDTSDVEQTVTYKIGDVKLDSLTQPADTLVIEFSYQVAALPDSITCIRIYAGIEAEFIGTNVLGQRQSFARIADSQVNTASVLDWRYEPSKKDFKAEDIVTISIFYSNRGNVNDGVRFKITLPSPGTIQWEVYPVSLPRGASLVLPINFSSLSVEIIDPLIPPDGTERQIIVEIKFRILELRTTTPAFVVTLFSPCDAKAQPPKGDTITKRVNIELPNLLSVQKSAAPSAVAPGEPINYTITITRIDTIGGVLDSVMVTDFLDSGIAAILNPAPPPLSQDINKIAWLLRSFPNSPNATRQITFTAVLRPDYYSAVVSNTNACKGVDFINRVDVRAIQNDSLEVKEGQMADNTTVTSTRVNPLGDLLSVAVRITDENDPSRVLPGDILRFVVHFANVNTFAPSGLFTVLDTLPSRQYVSAPFDIFPPRAIYDPATNTIRLDSLSLDALKSDSLFFKISIRDDIKLCQAVPIINDAVLKLLTGIDCELKNNTRTDTLSIANPQTALNLKVDMLPTEANPNDTVDILISYSSESSSLIPIKNITVVDTLDAGMQLVSCDPCPDSTAGQILFWRKLFLIPGQTKTINLGVQLIALLPCQTATLFTHASISSSPAACSLPSLASDSIILRGTDDLIDLRVVTSPPESDFLNASIEEEVKYEFTIINNSHFPAESLEVNDTLPPAEKFTVDVNSITPPGFFDQTRNTIVWNIPQLNVADSTIVSFTGNLIDRRYCAPDSLVNIVSLKATKLACPPEPHRTVHQISAAILTHTLELEDATRNHLAGEGEWITAKVTLQHQQNSRSDADSVTLHLKIQIEPGSASIEPVIYARPTIDTLITFLPFGSKVIWPVRFRFPDISPSHQRICVRAYYNCLGFYPSEEIERCINIEHECFAKPRTFIPAVHPNGLKFKPDDDLPVFIVDVDGNKIWEGKTSQAWDGRTNGGHPAAPGTYIYVIEDQCKGTIVLLR